ncbi:MAG: YgaP family membrane protein [Bacteroidales bacterium]
MKTNVGQTDRIVRILLAFILAALYFTGTLTGTIGIIAIILALVLVITGLVGFCPLYLPCRINTCKKEQSNS